MKEKTERNKLIRWWCKKGLSYRLVGDKFDLTRQRIHQIYKNGKPGFWRRLWNSLMGK